MTSTPISKAHAPHYDWGDNCHGWHLVRSPGLSVLQERMPPGASEVRHWHARARQFFYVLDGMLTIEVEGVVHLLAERTGLEVAPGLAHQVFNRTTADVEFLVVSEPPSDGDRHSEPET